MSTRTKVDAAADTLRSPGFAELANLGSGAFPNASATSNFVEGNEPPGCLGDDEILQYRQGELSPRQLDSVDVHLDACSRCRDIVDAVIADDAEGSATASQITTFHRGFVVAGRYEIQRFMGKGGMGEVYAAVDQMTANRVALKTVLCTATDDLRAVRKLFDEVLNAQRVAHPHVFKIYDLHEHHDQFRGRVPFFTMEFIEGESLGTRLRRTGSLPIAEVEIISQQLLSGLSAAHAKGVLHLDFKSDNVMLRQGADEPDAVIMDFGLSRAFDVESRQRTSERLQGAGTLPYMSIEQLECRPDLGPSSDVYSFGVVLYEMLTGVLPFRGESFSAVLLKQLRERPVAPSQRVPRLSPAVDAFVLKCLARDKRERPTNAVAALALAEAISTWERPAFTSATTRRRAKWVVATVVSMCVGAALLLKSGTPRSPVATTITRVAALNDEQPPTPPLPEPDVEIAMDTKAKEQSESAKERSERIAMPEEAIAKGAATGAKAPPPALSIKTQPAKPPISAESATPRTDAAAQREPHQWRGPPPRRIPKPLPLR